VAGLLGAGAPPDLDGCLLKPPGAERVSCLEPSFVVGAPGEREVLFLAKLAADDPSAAEQLAAAAEAATAASEPSTEGPTGARDLLRAELLDLRGSALQKLERYAEAAEAFDAALALDDGTARLTWLAEDGRVLWTASIDPGNRRQERAAGSFGSAGRPEQARAVLAHALASGAEGSAREAFTRVGGGTVPGLDPASTDLSARTWFPTLPDVEVKLHGGGAFRLSSARGKVLLLDFWASWCAPCLHELPRLEALHTAQKDAGLVVVTVNARESVEVARNTAQALKLTLPVGYYDDALDRAFNVRALPTIVLADGDGRMRSRWDSYVPDFDGEVASKVRSILGSDPEGAPKRVAEVLAGGALLRIEWLRELAGPVGGIAVVRNPEGGARVAVTSHEQLLVLEATGKIDRRHELPGAGMLRSLGGGAQGRFDLVSFRPGRQEFVWIESTTGASHTSTAASVLLDVAVQTPSPPERPEPRLILGSVDGVSTTLSEGPEARFGEGSGEIVSVTATLGGAQRRITALARDGRLSWFEPLGTMLGRQWAPSESRTLIAEEGGVGVGTLPPAAIAAAVGRFLDGERAQVAIATTSGQLVLVDLVTGKVRFRAKWPGISALAAGDLDGDGRDELLVAAGKTLAVLRRPPAEPAVGGQAGS